MRSGDVANAASLCGTLAFVWAITMRPSLFSASYLHEGFCVSFSGTLYNSHLLCFYVDSVLAALLAALCAWHPGDDRLTRVRESYLGVLGHGVGHLALHLSPVDTGLPLVVTASPIIFAVACFWHGFFCTLTRSTPFNLALSLANTAVLTLWVPRSFGFTYVQTVLMTAFLTRDLLRAQCKDGLYDLWSCVVNLPVVAVGWAEALSCDSWLIAWGGHAWYDAVIPVSILFYAALVLVREKAEKVA